MLISANRDRMRGKTIVYIAWKYRRLFIVAFHIFLVVLANYLAFWLKFDGAVPGRFTAVRTQMLPWLIVVRGLVFIPFGLYTGFWRYTGVWELRNIIGGVLVSTLAFATLVYTVFGLTVYPRSVLVIDAVLLLFFMGGSRMLRRLFRELASPQGKQRVLIYGAGDAGEMIVRDMKHNSAYTYEPVGLVDDNPTKIGQRIHGVQVLGTRQDLPRIMAATSCQEVLVAIPSAAPATIRAVVQALEPYKVPITTLPSLRDILNGKVLVNHIRDLAVEDLLARTVVDLDPEPVRHLIADKRVLVTGAGGSIGAELCRQIAALQPHTLILFERYENGLYAISNDLMRHDDTVHLRCVVGDVTDVQRVHAVLEEERPEIIFHAAAHKHVPLMEDNPCEAVKNNVLGTRRLAEAAAQYGVERFVLISSDKAVNPSSVMGATKRVAELLIQSMVRYSATRFLVVRFGNVLGSNGSVVPKFLAQIKAGGPVTVTHPEMRRYFMLIPEAVSLVLQAATLGRQGIVYVLDMGEQIKILDMARTMIRLAGYVPEEEIPIVFVGLRPGEKLYEELVGMYETIEPSGIDKIFQVRSSCPPDPEALTYQLADLEQMARHGATNAVLGLLEEMFPTLRLQHPAHHNGTVYK